MPENFLAILFVAAYSAVALLYFWRLIQCLAFQSRTKCTYHALWFLPYSVRIFVPALPEGYISSDRSILILILWIFSLVCAIIQLNFPLKNIQGWIVEARMKGIINFVDCFRHFLISAGDMFSRTFARFRAFTDLLLYSLLAVAAVFAPRSIFLLLLGYWIISLLCRLYRCISSCKTLVSFWMGRALISAILLSLFLINAMPAKTIAVPLLYCLICIFLTVFWSLSAGIVDYDVAKMAGAIINTFTTILLVAVNILFGWLQRDTQLSFFVNLKDISEKVIYIANLVIFPVVMAGYLAMLFADGLEYWRNRHKLPAFRGESLENSTSQK